jgi:hypothetical protein
MPTQPKERNIDPHGAGNVVVRHSAISPFSPRLPRHRWSHRRCCGAFLSMPANAKSAPADADPSADSGIVRWLLAGETSRLADMPQPCGHAHRQSVLE